jgi:hypothetical protein
LEELFISPLTQAIDEGIEWLDQNGKPEEHVRLLTVPACHLHAFWLEDKELKSRLMVIDVTGSAPEERRDTVLGLARFQIHDESEFLRGMSSAVAPVGVLLGGTQILTRA